MDDFRFQLTTKGYILSRETFDLEFKESFHLGDELQEYLRTLAGMANNKGGKIVFGIKNSPKLPVGLKSDKFENFDSNKLSQLMLEYMSPELNFEVKTLEFDCKQFGQISVEESMQKPILCRKSGKCLREGAIYYRYRAETREIAYSELNQILQIEKQKERELWIKHIQKISDIGPRNVQLLDTFHGELMAGDQKLLISKKLLDQVKFVREGHFVDKNGSPTLVLRGSIEGIVDQDHVVSSSHLFKYLTSDLQRMFSLNSHEIKCIIWKLQLKDNPEMHEEIPTGKTSSTHKYSKNAVDIIDASLKSDNQFVVKICDEYRKAKKK